MLFMQRTLSTFFSTQAARTRCQVYFLLVSIPAYRALGSDEMKRAAANRAIAADGIPEGELTPIRAAVQCNKRTDSEQFRNKIAARTGRRIPDRGRGRLALCK